MLRKVVNRKTEKQKQRQTDRQTDRQKTQISKQLCKKVSKRQVQKAQGMMENKRKCPMILYCKIKEK